MDADLDTLCTVIYCTADDLLPEARPNARRKVTDAELVTLCVAQAIMGIPSDRSFLRAAHRQLGHLFPVLPTQSAYWRRRRRLAGVLEWLMGVFAGQSPGFATTSCSSTRPRCPAPKAARRPNARSSPTRPATATAAATRAGTGASAVICWPLPTARRAPSRSPILLAASVRWRSSCSGGPRAAARSLVCDKGYAGREFAAGAASSTCSWCARRATDEPGGGPHLAPIRQRIESHLLDLQGPAHARASRRPHLGGSARAHPVALPLPGGLRRPQPPAGQAQPGPRRLLRLRLWAWNQSSNPLLSERLVGSPSAKRDLGAVRHVELPRTESLASLGIE